MKHNEERIARLRNEQSDCDNRLQELFDTADRDCAADMAEVTRLKSRFAEIGTELTAIEAGAER